MNTLRRIGTDLRKSMKAMTKTRDTETRVRAFITLYERPGAEVIDKVRALEPIEFAQLIVF